MRGQINGKFNNVTTMTANNNEVVAISNIINIIKGSKESSAEQSTKIRKRNANRSTVTRSFSSIVATKTFYYSLILFPEIPLQ